MEKKCDDFIYWLSTGCSLLDLHLWGYGHMRNMHRKWWAAIQSNWREKTFGAASLSAAAAK